MMMKGIEVRNRISQNPTFGPTRDILREPRIRHERYQR
jgi:hypothetical protein